ncbi:MAG: threonine synthase [Rhodospirillaceae bacterium]|nr:threonine synthase [Rhodospirillaceae bacterium]
MKYVSTRGGAPAIAFDEVVLSGMAPDGGLYLPDHWPALSEEAIAAMAGECYAEVAVRVMTPFLGDAIDHETFRGIVEDAYAGFANHAVAPLRQIDGSEWLMELFHGPTLAFKDVALQLLGRLFEHLLEKKGRHVTIVGATSGDTGSAAIEAFKGREHVTIVILHPHGRVSEVQRRQMTTVDAPNVHNVAIDGNFDDCQALVKELFADAAFREEIGLAAVNSINWARVMAQAVYYFTAAVALGAPGRRVAFSVPTGNFGDVFAGYVAARMGLPIERLIVATNRNDILARFFDSGQYVPGDVSPTLSPSMDIQVASNFERLLFDLFDGDGARVAALMDTLKSARRFGVDEGVLDRARTLFDSTSVAEEDTIETMRRLYSDYALTIDPHTAVGVAAGRVRHHMPATPLVTLSTAHPAKFPDAVVKATGVHPALPPHLDALMTLPERCTPLANDLAKLRDYIRRLN